MYSIIIDYDLDQQESYGPFDTWQEAHAAMPQVIEKYPNFNWCQIEKES